MNDQIPPALGMTLSPWVEVLFIGQPEAGGEIDPMVVEGVNLSTLLGIEGARA